MWVSVPRAKVKSVAGVVEVGRIRVTDQRAPREPAPGKPRRSGGGGGCGGALGLIESAYREQNSRSVYRLSACLFVFLPSFAPLRLSFAPDFISNPPPSCSLHERPAFSFAPCTNYPSPIVRARLSILFRCSALSTTFRSVLSSNLSLSPFPFQSLLSSFLSFRPTVRSSR